MTALRACVVIALLLAGCGGRMDEAPSTASADRNLDFVPATHRAGNRVVLPVTFPDGTSAELVYPPELEIAELGILPYTSGTLHGKSTEPGRGDFVGRDFVIRLGDVDDLLGLDELLGSRSSDRPRLLAEYEGVDGQTVGFWEAGWDEGGVNHLGFQFGRWGVLVYDYRAAGAMSDAERASWAASFSGRETEGGFLVLEGSGPLRLARAGEHAGPQLTFSAGDPNRALLLFPGDCRPPREQTRFVDGKLVSWHGPFASWCLSDSMRVHAEGNRDFVGALIRELEVRNVAIANG